MKRYKPEPIATLLRQIQVETANGKTTPQACKEADITVQTSYRWRKECGGLGELQHDAAAQRARLQAAGARGL